MFESNESEEGEGAGMLRWLITYADLITLLLAFFIILYAMNRTEQIKFSLISQALANQFDSTNIVGQSPGPSIMTGLSGTRVTANVSQLKSLNALQDELQQAVTKRGLGQRVSVSSNLRGVEVSLNASLLFKPGSARLSATALSLLNEVGLVLEKVSNDVEVAGYTDSTPIHTTRYPSNWQLSAMRAANVVYVLANVPNMNPSRFSISAFSKYHPIASNATSAGRQANRRVNILVLRHSVALVAIGNGP